MGVGLKYKVVAPVKKKQFKTVPAMLMMVLQH